MSLKHIWMKKTETRAESKARIAAEKAERMAASLRENLKRRKAQARGRDTGKTGQRPE